MANEDALVILRNRKTHAPVREIAAWSNLRFRQERYRSATGSLDFVPGAVDNELFRLLNTGNYGISIYATLESGEEVHYYGFIDNIRLSSPTGGNITYHLHDLANEVIARGGGQGAQQTIVRTPDTYAQNLYAFHETQNWQTSTSTTAILTWKNQDILQENDRKRRESDPDMRLDSGLYDVTLRLVDQLGYLDHRFVDTTNQNHLYGTSFLSSTQLQDLYKQQMTGPTLTRRRIDISASSAASDFTGGEQIRESVRWEKLSTVSESIARRADLTLTHDLASVSGVLTVKYGCKDAVDMRDSSPPITEILAGDLGSNDEKIGEIYRRQVWIDVETESEPVDTFDVICTRREFWRSSSSEWKVKPMFENYRRSLWNQGT